MAAATKPAAADAETPVVEAPAEVPAPTEPVAPEAPAEAPVEEPVAPRRAFTVLRDFKAQHETQLVSFLKDAVLPADDPCGETLYAAGAPLKPLP